MRLKHVSVHSEMPFLKLPSPITRLFSPAASISWKLLPEVSFSLGKFLPILRGPSTLFLFQEAFSNSSIRLLSNLGQVQRGHLSTLSDYVIYPITC